MPFLDHGDYQALWTIECARGFGCTFKGPLSRQNLTQWLIAFGDVFTQDSFAPHPEMEETTPLEKDLMLVVRIIQTCTQMGLEVQSFDSSTRKVGVFYKAT